MKKIRILLAECGAELHTLLQASLRHEPDFEVVGEAKTGAQALALTQAIQPHVVLIDPEHCDGLGLETIYRMTELWPSLRIVALTTSADPMRWIALQRAGATYLLEKGSATQTSLQAIMSVLRNIAQSAERFEPET